MKKTTCSALGGSCDAEITGENAEEIAANGKQHVHDQAEAGDAGHLEIIEKMKGLSEEDHAKWMEDLQGKFEGLEDA